MKSVTPEVVLLGVKRTVIAFERKTGRRVWSRELASGMSGDFVTVIADDTRVYAHTHGKIYCLDLATGTVLWEDQLPGLGYGIASLALPGSGSAPTPALAARVALDDSSGAATSAQHAPNA